MYRQAKIRESKGEIFTDLLSQSAQRYSEAIAANDENVDALFNWGKVCEFSQNFLENFSFCKNRF